LSWRVFPVEARPAAALAFLDQPVDERASRTAAPHFGIHEQVLQVADRRKRAGALVGEVVGDADDLPGAFGDDGFHRRCGIEDARQVWRVIASTGWRS
jgi:hypothetical protein